MAEHADATERVADPVRVDRQGGDPAESTDSPVAGTRAVIAAGLVVAMLGGLAGWLGYRAYHAHRVQAQHAMFVQLARQAAVNLTTISYTEVDADVQRILDSATGTFHDDFQQRSQPFVDVVKQTQSKSEGTVTEAALESVADDQAQVLVAVSVRTSIAAAPDQDPRRWRMRISVQQVGDSTKVSNVVFVP
ncbi:mammalian cell entry protein [Mycobacterium sp. pUA109]|uniref:mammalian cell entry protein n=1 Tax=Mycobacterium sp. pUA109 TaxID=3238982 RepID=UPI00351AED0B